MCLRLWLSKTQTGGHSRQVKKTGGYLREVQKDRYKKDRWLFKTGTKRQVVT